MSCSAAFVWGRAFFRADATAPGAEASLHGVFSGRLVSPCTALPDFQTFAGLPVMVFT